MRLKKIVTFFCFLVLTFQLLPVRQLGSLLFSNSLTEEFPHDDDNGGGLKECKHKLYFFKDFIFSSEGCYLSFMQTAISQYIHFNIVLPSLPAGDVQTPPPNVV